MKIRTGFVSNSSSSSFLVHVRDVHKKRYPRIISSKQEHELLVNGFRKTLASIPANIPPFWDEITWSKENKAIADKLSALPYNLGYEVTCNQDETLCMLIQMGIPFVASCHYDQENYQYIPKTDELWKGINFGRIMETYGPGELNSFYICKQKPFEVSKGAEFVKQHNL